MEFKKNITKICFLLIASVLLLTVSSAEQVEAYGGQPYDRFVSGCYNCYPGAFTFSYPQHYYRNEFYRPTYGVGAYYGHNYGYNTLAYSRAYPSGARYTNYGYGYSRYYAPRPYIYSNSYESLRYRYNRYW